MPGLGRHSPLPRHLLSLPLLNLHATQPIISYFLPYCQQSQQLQFRKTAILMSIPAYIPENAPPSSAPADLYRRARKMPRSCGGRPGQGLREVLQEAGWVGAAQKVEGRLVVVRQQTHQVAAQLGARILHHSILHITLLSSSKERRLWVARQEPCKRQAVLGKGGSKLLCVKNSMPSCKHHTVL